MSANFVQWEMPAMLFSQTFKRFMVAEGEWPKLAQVGTRCLEILTTPKLEPDVWKSLRLPRFEFPIVENFEITGGVQRQTFIINV